MRRACVRAAPEGRPCRRAAVRRRREQGEGRALGLARVGKAEAGAGMSPPRIAPERIPTAAIRQSQMGGVVDAKVKKGGFVGRRLGARRAETLGTERRFKWVERERRQQQPREQVCRAHVDSERLLDPFGCVFGGGARNEACVEKQDVNLLTVCKPGIDLFRSALHVTRIVRTMGAAERSRRGGRRLGLDDACGSGYVGRSPQPLTILQIRRGSAKAPPS